MWTIIAVFNLVAAAVCGAVGLHDLALVALGAGLAGLLFDGLAGDDDD
jgi:hypothetical protein